MNQYSKHVGLDVHKATVAVAIAAINGPARTYGTIPNTPGQITKMVKKLTAGGEVAAFCYEAGPCGYEIHRQIRKMGHDCMVVAPALIPRKPGLRIKTDRRDAISLARLFRAEELSPVWVPGPEREAIRDLVRCRGDFKSAERRAKQRLGAFLLRHGKVYGGSSRWIQAHFRWLEQQRFERPAQQVVLQEYIDQVKHLVGRVESIVEEMRGALEGWSLEPVVRGLMAMRGISLVASMTIVSELGDITRFDSPSELMAYIGLVPSEHSSGERCNRGGITKTGNSHVRRVLVEGAWSHRFYARKTRVIERRAERTTDAVRAIAWKAQKRLCGRYRHLTGRGKKPVKVAGAIAREMLGFIWAIAWSLKESESVC